MLFDYFYFTKRCTQRRVSVGKVVAYVQLAKYFGFGQYQFYLYLLNNRSLSA